jgi:ribonucleoside-diphosphate reductase alpha chain
MSYAQVKQIRKKYAIQNSVKKIEYETPQFVFMRMAMKLAQNLPAEKRMAQIQSFYDDFSQSAVNAPSPNYLNLGTPLNGYASCCLYVVGDSIDSLAIGDHIAYKFTAMSAGIGGTLQTRSIGEPVRGGKIEHLGKLSYYGALAKAVKANIQAGRGGACTSYLPMFDPEIEKVLMLQNPRTPVDKQNRDMHFAWQDNYFFARKVFNNEDIFHFNSWSAPDLFASFFSGDGKKFEELYKKYEADPNFKKTYSSARHLLRTGYEQRNEVGTLYRINMEEVNRHTPHKEPINSSNLCAEITQPTKPYERMQDLFLEEDHGRGEVSMCSLGGIVITNIRDDEHYYQACYNALLMIDECIHMSDYPFPHVGYTAKQRLNAGVGILGLAHHLARLGLRYDTKEGLEEMHRVAERHTYFLIKASLQLGKERGNAPWMHKTKWPEGWLPIDTYNKNVDQLVAPVYQYDWEALRAEIIANGGIRNSSLVAHMPTESSSKASGAPNSIYPVRDLSLKKTDVSNSLDWVAPDNDILEDAYQLAWEVPIYYQAAYYGVFQKWADQSISADFYRDRTKTVVNEKGQNVIAPLSDIELFDEYYWCNFFGVKSSYYNNSFTGGAKLEEIVIKQVEQEKAAEQTALIQQLQEMQASNKVEVLTPLIEQVQEVQQLAVDTITRVSEGSKPDIPTGTGEIAADDEIFGDGGGDTKGCAGGFCTL